MNARRLVLATLATLSTVAGGLLFSGAAAQAALTHNFVGSFGVAGPGSGAFSEPQGVAVDQSTGDVYVYNSESGKPFIYKFNAAGAPVDFSALGTNVIAGSGETYPFGGYSQIAVDSSSGPDAGDIYVVESGSGQVTVYGANGDRLGELNSGVEADGGPWSFTCGVAVDPAGNVYVGLYESHVDKYTPSGNPVSNSDYVSSLAGLPEGSCNLAADVEGNVYVTSNEGPVTKYEALQFGSLAASGTVIAAHGSAVAIDPAPSDDDVYVDEGASVAEYDSAGGLLGRFGAGGAGALSGVSNGVAVNHASGKVYVSDPEEYRGKGPVNIYGPGVVVPDVSVKPVSALLPTSVTLNGTVNPDNEGNATCEFQYATSASYEEKDSYDQTAACSPAVLTGNSPVPVTADLAGLSPHTTYHYRLDATNGNGANYGEDATFTTTGPPAIESESVSDVAATSATLQAQINPGGNDTHYYFQYGTASCAASPSSCTDVPAAPGSDIGASESSVPVSEHVQGLTPDTQYHYRAVATNVLGTIVYGTDHTFITEQRPGTALVLPDGRKWELVSPPYTDGAVMETPAENNASNPQNEVTQAADNGDAIAYGANAPIGETEGNAALEKDEVFSARGPDGWSSRTIVTPTSSPGSIHIGWGSDYTLFSQDLSLGLAQPLSSTLLSPEASEGTIYLRSDYAGGNPGDLCTTLCYRPLVSGCPAPGEPCAPIVAEHADIPAGTKLNGERGNETERQNPYDVGFAGASPDLEHVVFESEAALTSNAVKNGSRSSLYEWTAGQLQLVSVLPNGKPADVEGEDANLGDEGQVEPARGAHAVSSDGSRVIWNNADVGNGDQHQPSHLYMRDTASGETVMLDAAQEAPEPPRSDAIFQWASSDGSRVFFTDGQRLTAGSHQGQNLYDEGKADLYEFEVTSGSGEPLAGKLTDLTVDEHAGETANVDQVMGASEDGSYVYFTAGGVLAAGATTGVSESNLYVLHDTGTEWTTTFISTVRPEFYENNARVSPDGGFIVFESSKGVSLYDADTGRVVCVSCSATGEEDAASESSLPYWTQYAHYLAYQPRYLSDSGRVFFDSKAALVPQDTNGQTDVYEYEPEGVGSCDSSSTTFNEATGGCVGLISSGTSSEESLFLDASENGDDVFFLTSERLISQEDIAGLHVYDAHVCSAAVPCTTAAVAPPACTTTDSCRVAPSPQPAIFGAPPSATFSGAGNIAPPSPPKKVVKKTVKCKKGFVKNKKNENKKNKCVRKQTKKKSKEPKKASKSSRGGKS